MAAGPRGAKAKEDGAMIATWHMRSSVATAEVSSTGHVQRREKVSRPSVIIIIIICFSLCLYDANYMRLCI